jgi:hypothetical protein
MLPCPGDLSLAFVSTSNCNFTCQMIYRYGIHVNRQNWGLLRSCRKQECAGFCCSCR